MPFPDPLQPVLHLVEVVAGAIRDVLGADIDAYPGARVPEQAEPMNRAFRAIARALLLDQLPSAADVGSMTSAVLHEATERRLSADGWNPDEVRFLISLEGADRDDWLIFLLLSSRTQIEPLFTPDEPDRN